MSTGVVTENPVVRNLIQHSNLYIDLDVSSEVLMEVIQLCEKAYNEGVRDEHHRLHHIINEATKEALK